MCEVSYLSYDFLFRWYRECPGLRRVKSVAQEAPHLGALQNAGAQAALQDTDICGPGATWVGLGAFSRTGEVKRPQAGRIQSHQGDYLGGFSLHFLISEMGMRFQTCPKPPTDSGSGSAFILPPVLLT